MKKPADKPPIKNLRDAYKVSGFRVRARLDSYEHEPPACALTLDRRSKKRCAAGAEKPAGTFTTNVGDERAIWGVVTEKSISIFKCVA